MAVRLYEVPAGWEIDDGTGMPPLFFGSRLTAVAVHQELKGQDGKQAIDRAQAFRFALDGLKVAAADMEAAVDAIDGGSPIPGLP